MELNRSWGRVILVVEDDPVVAELLMLRLSMAGYRPNWVKTGLEALTRTYELQPHLILLDLGLPAMDGFEVLATLRSHCDFARVPIVMMTARHGSADVKRALAMGATDYIAKPFEPQDLIKRIERHLAAANAAEAKRRTLWIS
jgi:DNA-binding response OmpR family regulator